MQQTGKHFIADKLIETVKKAFKKRVSNKALRKLDDLSCVMAAFAVFSLKYPSLLQFDKDHTTDKVLAHNLHKVYEIQHIPSDTSMRERLDVMPTEYFREPFNKLIATLQRQKILDRFKGLDNAIYISLDGTEYFNSYEVHCTQCCERKITVNGEKVIMYYHQALSAAIVHPNEKVVFPLAPEPIIKKDGKSKNDCELNASLRWVEEFRKDHPHLKVIILADSLSSNATFIRNLKAHNLGFILVAKDGSHASLLDYFWNNNPTMWTEEQKDSTETYAFLNNVPLNASNDDLLVNVARYKRIDKKSGKESVWMFVTHLKITKNNIDRILKAGRTRWKIENETFNTLKNQGYNFEHNYGHGEVNLNVNLMHVMFIAFFVDQILQYTNKLYQAAREKTSSKWRLYEIIRSFFLFIKFDTFEDILHFIVYKPTDIELKTVLAMIRAP
ncbi:MAG: transposase [Gammaproteobacteria bacterium]